MLDTSPMRTLSRADLGLLLRLAPVQKISLGVTALLAIFSLLARFSPSFQHMQAIASLEMPLHYGLAALAASLCVALSLVPPSAASAVTGRLLAVFVIAAMLHQVLPSHLSAMFNAQSGSQHAAFVLPLATLAWLLMGVLLLFLRRSTHIIGCGIDLLLAILILVVLILLSTYVSQDSAMPPAWKSHNSLGLMCVLTLLTFSIFLVRAEHGIYGLFLGSGFGSRFARVLTPILFTLPILRELVRARLLQSNVLPAHYATPIMVSSAVLISMCLLFAVAYRFQAMERQIQQLTYQDELTGLYNLRGFQMIAQQTMLLARHSNQSFSVLYADMDDLKQINDTLGHATGSAVLAQLAQHLKESFRDAEVIGRLGGDEFAVAGRFNASAIAAAAHKFTEQLNHKEQWPGITAAPGLSIGYATADSGGKETLRELLDRADAAMYEQKRRKKLP